MIYIHEYKKLILICINFIHCASHNEKIQILEYAIPTIFTFIEKCHTPSILLQEIKKDNTELASLLYSRDINGLYVYLQLTPIQRLRKNVKLRLITGS